MGKIKDKALNAPNEKKFTLTESEIDTLMQYRAIAQQELDQMLQRMTSVYLDRIAKTRFGYAQNCNLGYALQLDQKQDNITVTNLS